MNTPDAPWIQRDSGMRKAFNEIRRDAVMRVRSPTKWRLWPYEQLGELYGSLDAWSYEGVVRGALYGAGPRLWLQEEHGLWWTAEGSAGRGLRFTADPRTGLRWERVRIALESLRAGEYLEAMATRCEAQLPTFRPEFRDTAEASKRMTRAAKRLLAISPEESTDGN